MVALDDLVEVVEADGEPTHVPEAADPWATMLIRLGFAAMLAYLLGHLIFGPFGPTGPISTLTALYSFALLSTLVAMGLTWTTWYDCHWRELVFAECSVVLIGAMAASPTEFFAAVLLLELGTGALIPWGARGQAAFVLVCGVGAVSILILHGPNELSIYRWFELGVASAFSLLVAGLADRYRREIRARINTLQESEDKLWKIFYANPDIVTIATFPEGRYLNVSSQFLRSGYSKAEVLGATEREVKLWADQAQFAEYEQRLISLGHVNNMEATFRLKDGRTVPCLISGTVVQLSLGQCVVSVTRDISRIKQASHELMAARKAAESASRAKSEFISNMSHEIRTPMNAILGMAEVLADSSLSSEQRKYLSIMMNSGNSLLNLINDILDFARVESGKLSLEQAAFDLCDLAERVAETLSIRAHQKGLDLAVRIAPDVPPGLIGDELRLRQVVTNLLGNAIKFTATGEIVLAIERDTDAEAGVLHFSVADTGIGIAPDEREKIFTSYAQAESSTARKYGGTGLGLAIVKQLVELMGGRIWVESELGKGSTFHFTARFGLQPGHATDENDASLAGIRILVVDGTAINRLSLAEILSRRGAIVTQAASGEEALELLRASARAGTGYALTLLDCRMPSIDGFDVARIMRRERLDGGMVIIPMLTLDDLNVRLPTLRKMGLIHHLIKPVRRAELLDLIKGLIGKIPHQPQAESMRTSVQSLHLSSDVTVQGSPAGSAAPAPPYVLAAPSVAAAAQPRRPLHVLVADDSADNRLLIDAFLKKAGWLLDEAENGEVAVQKFIAGKYDVVLMDIQMPVMDGYAAVRRIRKWERENRTARTPIIALTASVLDEAVSKSFEVGCDTHVSKPVRRPTLFSAIREVIGADQKLQMADPISPAPALSPERGDRTHKDDAETYSFRPVRTPNGIS